MYLVKTPFLLRWFYPSLTWRKSRSEKVIYLTFDDGPIPVVTPFVLKTLKTFGAKATFFCIGDNIRKHPEIYSMLREAGHQVGNHTYNHLRGWDHEDGVYLENVRRCNDLTQSRLFRPPYGRAKRSQYRRLLQQYEVIMWDVLSGDFDTSLSPEKCLKNVTGAAENGSIVVFHDSEKAFGRLEYTLPRALSYWSAAGYTFAAL
jgi:peptidoglycan/xylan/chitin deacetylase (PgdA/CDA1 family)